ncbi:MAG TPA: hypothetical protein VK463_15690 [Desulfomonilaceae bacterium]|nr:hypothetical protein [Desulfomonilaceae bacterium]
MGSLRIMALIFLVLFATESSFCLAQSQKPDSRSMNVEALKQELADCVSPRFIGQYNYSPAPLPKTGERLTALLGKIEAYNSASPGNRKETEQLEYLTRVACGMYDMNVFTERLNAQKDKKRVHREMRKSLENARSHFLRAALLDGERPEAYVCLGYLEFEDGNIRRSDYYTHHASQAAAPPIELTAVRARKHEATGNYSAAALTYARAAFSRDELVDGTDEYLLYKLSRAVLQAEAPYHWVPPVFSYMIWENETQIYPKRQKLIEFITKSLGGRSSVNSSALCDELLYLYGVFPRAVSYYWLATKFPHYNEPFNLTALSTLADSDESGGSLDKKSRLKAPANLIDAFLDARLSYDKSNKEDLTYRWNELTEVAREFKNTYPDPVKRAVALIDWLRNPDNNALREYNMLYGISAAGILGKNDRGRPRGEYFCMTGAVTYALLGREADLPIKVWLQNGHAYCVLESGGRTYEIDTTHDPKQDSDPIRCQSLVCEYSKRPQGSLFSLGGLRLPIKAEGVVSNEFAIGCNYGNTASCAFDIAFVLPQYSNQVKDLLLSKYKVEDKQADHMIEQWRKFAPEQAKTLNHNDETYVKYANEIQMELLKEDEKFRKEYTDLVRDGIMLAIKGDEYYRKVLDPAERKARTLGRLQRILQDKALRPFRHIFSELNSAKQEFKPELLTGVAEGSSNEVGKTGQKVQQTGSRPRFSIAVSDTEQKKAQAVWNAYKEIITGTLSALMEVPGAEDFFRGLQDQAVDYANQFGDHKMAEDLRTQRRKSTGVLAVQR